MPIQNNPSPSEAKPVFECDQLLSIVEVADLTGHTRRTLQTYASFRRGGRYLGPRPTTVPGFHVIFYKLADVQAYLHHGLTGGPAESGAE